MTAPSTDRILRQAAPGWVNLTLPDPSFALVRFVISTRQGAIFEPAGRPGAMRLMFEMLLRGTCQRSRHAFGAALEELGAQVDVSVGHEMAVCRGVTLKRHLSAVWELLTEALTAPAFDAAELQRLKAECLEELISERDDDDAVAEIFLRRALYGSHRLGERAGGSSADLLGLDAAAVRAAFNQFCRQELIVGWAGDITPEQAEQHTAQLVAARQKAQQPLGVPPPNPVVVAAVPPLQAPKVLLVDKPDRTQAQLRLGALGPLLPNPDCEAFWLAVLAFGGTFTSPFTREVRDERGWSYVAHADYRRQARLAAPVTLRCAPALEDAAACMALTIRLYGDLARGKLDDPLVDNVRHYILNRYPFEVATAFDMLGAAMAQELCLLPQGHLFGLPDRLQALSNEATRSAPTRHLQAAAYAAVVVAPSASLLPALRQALGKQVEIEVVDYQAGVGQITPA